MAEADSLSLADVGSTDSVVCDTDFLRNPLPKQVGMKLFYNQYGQEGPPLIILHGLLGSSDNWHTLSRTSFSDISRVYALDLRNHGRSPHSEDIDYETMAADVRTFINRHNLGTVNLLGHSMGGKVAMQTALSYADVVDGLIVADMTPRAYPPSHRDLLDALHRLDPSRYDSRSEIDATLAEDVSSWPVRQFLLKNLKYNGEEYTWKPNLEAIRTNYDAILEALPEQPTFHGPTLFVRGGNSDYVLDEDLPEIRTRFPSSELVTIDHAGHWVHADTPDAFAEVVTDFLTDGEPSPSR